MGADTKQLRTRIKSVNSTLHLTKAMELVASSKIRKATESMQRGKEYAAALVECAEQLSTFEECKKSPFMEKREAKNTCLAVVAGDRGLAGGYNANIFRLMRELEYSEVIPIGKRACEKYGASVASAEHFSFSDAKIIAKRVCDDFREKRIDRFGIVCTKYNSLMSQEARVIWLLPLERANTEKSASALFEPDELTVLNSLIPEYVAGVLIAAVKESFASEVAARRVAMDSAGKNATEMIEKLELDYNRARQGAITQEITEIVAGAGM